MNLGIALGQAAPLYNLGLVVIMVFLFVKLFSSNKTKQYMFPWKLLFVAVAIFVVEQVLTIVRRFVDIGIPEQINGFFELSIVIIFIYMLMLQKENIKQIHKKVIKNVTKKIIKKRKTKKK